MKIGKLQFEWYGWAECFNPFWFHFNGRLAWVTCVGPLRIAWYK